MIPQNKHAFFILEKDSWNFSLNILFKHSDSLNVLNFFLIIKSYLDDPSVLITCFYIIIKNLNNSKITVLRTLPISKFQKMHFLDFEIFVEELLDNDEIYLNNFQFYGIKIVFHPLSTYWKEGIIFPDYPWKKTFVNRFIRKKENDARYVNFLERKIKILQNSLRYRVYNGRFNSFRKKTSKKF